MTPQMFGAKGDGIHDDTINIQKAINYCSINKLTLKFLPGIYKITDTIEICKLGLGKHQFVIDFNSALIIADKNIFPTDKEMFLVRKPTEEEDKTNIDWAQGWFIKLINLNLSGNFKANTGLYIKQTQGVVIDSLHIDQCKIGLKVKNVYYGKYEGHNVINNCHVGICLTGDKSPNPHENNAVIYNGFWICGGSKCPTDSALNHWGYNPQDSIGIELQTGGFALAFNNITIETYGYGIKQTDNQEVSKTRLHLNIENCYFEHIKTSFIDISNKNFSYNIVTIKNCHGNEEKESLSNYAIIVAKGDFTILNNNFKDNIVKIKGQANVETDMKTCITTISDEKFKEDGKTPWDWSNHGWQQTVQNVSHSYKNHTLEKYVDNSEKLFSIKQENTQNLYKIHPINSINNIDALFLNGSGIVLTAINDDGSNVYYRLIVDKQGNLSTEAVSNYQLGMLKPQYYSVSIDKIVNHSDDTKINNYLNFIKYYPYDKFRIKEITPVDYIINEERTTAKIKGGIADGLEPVGNIDYIINVLNEKFNNFETSNYYFIYNIDINRFYVLQQNIEGKNYWAWAGTNPVRETSTLQAIGTTDQIPNVNNISNFIYYDTTLSKYIKWDNNLKKWVDYK